MKSWDSLDQSSLCQAGTAWSSDGQVVAEAKIQAKLLLDLTEELLLTQSIKNPTKESAILDLVFCNTDELIENTDMIENLKLSDYRTLVSKLSLFPINQSITYKKQLFIFFPPRL